MAKSIWNRPKVLVDVLNARSAISVFEMVKNVAKSHSSSSSVHLRPWTFHLPDPSSLKRKHQRSSHEPSLTLPRSSAFSVFLSLWNCMHSLFDRVCCPFWPRAVRLCRPSKWSSTEIGPLRIRPFCRSARLRKRARSRRFAMTITLISSMPSTNCSEYSSRSMSCSATSRASTTRSRPTGPLCPRKLSIYWCWSKLEGTWIWP